MQGVTQAEISYFWEMSMRIRAAAELDDSERLEDTREALVMLSEMTGNELLKQRCLALVQQHPPIRRAIIA